METAGAHNVVAPALRPQGTPGAFPPRAVPALAAAGATPSDSSASRHDPNLDDRRSFVPTGPPNACRSPG